MKMNKVQYLDILFRRPIRNHTLQNSIFDAIKDGSKVLDAGCGFGLLTLWAAQAGASQVVGVDMCDLSLAKELAKENKLSEKTTFIQSNLQSLDPNKIGTNFDVVLGLVYFNDPRRDEQQSKIISRIYENFLVDGGLRIPSRVEYTGYACEWSAQDIRTYYSNLKSELKAAEGYYNLSFNAVFNDTIKPPLISWFPERELSGALKRSDARILSEETLFTTIDYTESFEGYPKDMNFKISSPGVFTTVIWAQKLYYKNVVIFYNESVSWIGEPIRVNKDDEVKIMIDDYWRTTNILQTEKS